MEAPFVVPNFMLSFSSDAACKENVNLCFNARELQVLCWVDEVFKSEKICCVSGFIASERNRVPVQSQLCLEIVLTVRESYKMNKTTLFC